MLRPAFLNKMTMLPPRLFPSPKDPLAVLHSWPFWCGLALYGAAFLLCAAALARLPLNVVHPILNSGAVASVAALSVVLFWGPIHWTQAVGMIPVTAGIAVITATAS